MQHPTRLYNKRSPIFKPHKSRSKILHIKFFGNCTTTAPHRTERALLMRQFRLRYTRYSHGIGIAHQPQGQIQNVNANINTRPATTVLFHNKTRPRGHTRTPQHPASRVIHMSQNTRFHFLLHCQEMTRKTATTARTSTICPTGRVLQSYPSPIADWAPVVFRKSHVYPHPAHR